VMDTAPAQMLRKKTPNIQLACAEVFALHS
jgi:hypothetical protein